MKKLIATTFLIAVGFFTARGQSVQPDQSLLNRRYREGETLIYHMKGVNENWHYQAQATGIVKKDSAGYFEEYGWSKFVSDGKEVTLPPASAGFRQQLTLDPNHNPSFPNLAQVDSMMIGPITDLLTFYADVWLAIKTRKVKQAGDHFYFKRPGPNSWADGNYVLLGEDTVDFDITLKGVDQSDHTVVLIVRHVPPESPQIKLPAAWMQERVADTANNWVQVNKLPGGKYLAAVGKEFFDVEVKLSQINGVILSATMDNRVITVERECEDAALTKCGGPKPHPIRRQIEIALER